MDESKPSPIKERIRIQLIDVDDVPAQLFPFFTSYTLYFDSGVNLFGFYTSEELIAVTALITDDPERKDGFFTYGYPILYVFEVRKDLRNQGYGKICARMIIEELVDGDTVQLCCSAMVAPFWEKIGFELRFVDQSLYIHKMIFERIKKNKNEK